MNGSDILYAIANVIEAGAEKSRQWVLNNDRQQDAQVFQAMADRARAEARHLEELENIP